MFTSWHADGQQSSAEWVLAKDEGGSSSGAALLSISIGEHRAFFGEAIDAGRLITHHTMVVGADVVHADVVTPNDDDVGLVLGLQRQCGQDSCRYEHES